MLDRKGRVGKPSLRLELIDEHLRERGKGREAALLVMGEPCLDIGLARGSGIDRQARDRVVRSSSKSQGCTRRSTATRKSPAVHGRAAMLEGVGQFPKFQDQYYGVAEGDDRRSSANCI